MLFHRFEMYTNYFEDWIGLSHFFLLALYPRNVFIKDLGPPSLKRKYQEK